MVLLPRGLAHARDHPEQRQLAEADAAEAEAAQERARPSAAPAAIVLTDRELRLPLALLDHGFTGPLLLLGKRVVRGSARLLRLLVGTERHTELLQQRVRLVVAVHARDERDVH